MTELTDRLAAAVKAVDNAGIPEDLREAAFNAAFWSIAASPSCGTNPHGDAGDPAEVASTTPWAGDQSDLDARASQIAEALGIGPELVACVYDLEEEQPDLAIPARVLPDGLRPAAEQVAYLIVGARQALGEDWTKTQVVKTALEGRGYVDKSRNLHRVWDELDGRGLFVKGSGRDRRVKINGPGFKRAGELAKEYASAMTV